MYNFPEPTPFLDPKTSQSTTSPAQSTIDEMMSELLDIITSSTSSDTTPNHPAPTSFNNINQFEKRQNNDILTITSPQTSTTTQSFTAGSSTTTIVVTTVVSGGNGGNFKILGGACDGGFGRMDGLVIMGWVWGVIYGGYLVGWFWR